MLSKKQNFFSEKNYFLSDKGYTRNKIFPNKRNIFFQINVIRETKFFQIEELSFLREMLSKKQNFSQ